ncbi:MAG TPA: hypothetical protein PL033_09375 [Candidatus Brocadiia bacterium]|nr:hypothetical protein [Candidatus Brocadiia bacterium]
MSELRDTAADSSRAFTARSVLIGLTGAALIVAADYVNAGALGNSPLIGILLPPGVVTLLVVAAAANGLLRRVSPRAALARGELLVAIGLIWAASGVSGWGLVRNLLPTMVMPYRLMISSPYQWEPVAKELPSWLAPACDPESPIINDFMAGVGRERAEGLGIISAVPWGAWVGALAGWIIGIGALYGLVLCLGAVFLRQWALAEHLPFPSAQVPLVITEPPTRGRAMNDLFSSKAFWMAFAVVFIVGMASGLNAYYPKVPIIKYNFAFWGIWLMHPLTYASEWLFIGSVFFSMVGIGLLLSLDTTFSIWFCFMLVQVWRIISGLAGRPMTSWMTWEPQPGALLVYCIMFLYIGRRYYKNVAASILSREKALALDLMRERRWAIGAVVCAAVFLAWLFAAGMPLWAAIIVMGLHLMIIVGLMRVLAETGMTYLQTDFRSGPYLVETFGKGMLTKKATAVALVTGAVCYDQRDHPLLMSHTALRVTAGPDSRPGRRMLGGIGSALGIAFISACAVGLILIYKYGSEKVDFWGTISLMTLGGNALAAAETGNRSGQIVINMVGAGVMAVISALRLRFPWWPIHPAGYFIAIARPGERVWFSMMLAWAIKFALLRYGGTRMAAFARNMGIGFIVGEAVIHVFWVAVAALVWLSGGEPRPFNFSC